MLHVHAAFACRRAHASAHLQEDARLHHARVEHRVRLEEPCVEGHGHEGALAAVDGAQDELACRGGSGWLGRADEREHAAARLASAYNKLHR